MDKVLLHFLKARKIFSSIGDVEIKNLLPRFTRIELEHGHLLFRQGDPSDGVYILVSGKLSTLLKSTNNRIKTIGHIEAGETVGELGVLTNKARSFSVKALHNCILYKLPSHDFVELCYAYPSVIFSIIHPVVSPAHNIVHLLSPDEKNKYIVMIPANNHTSLNKFIANFTKACAKFKSVILLSDFGPEFNDKELNAHTLKEKIHHVEQNRKPSQKIICLLKSAESLLGKIALKKAGRLYVMANAEASPKIDQHLLDYIHQGKSHLKTKPPNLILLHSEQTLAPQNTGAWLNHLQFNMYHHVKIDVIRHYKRLLRFIRCKAIELVLSGGGTRGWAHLGALKALRQQKIPIDFIGGTSVGAIIAGCYAIQESYAEAYEKFQQLVTASEYSTSWRSLTWPIVSIFNGKYYTHAEMQVFNNILIEDLWLPYFCVSSNLANYTEEIHRTGLLWEKTRASSAIPGLIPPMTINGDIHLDGGLLNNLPVNVMREFIGTKAKIIAINLTAAMDDAIKYNFPPVLTLKQALLTKLHLRRPRYKFPRFIDTFLRGLLMGSYAKSKQNGSLATILINVSLQKFMLLHSDNKMADKMLDIGYQETLAQIHEYKNKKA